MTEIGEYESDLNKRDRRTKKMYKAIKQMPSDAERLLVHGCWCGEVHNAYVERGFDIGGVRVTVSHGIYFSGIREGEPLAATNYRLNRSVYHITVDRKSTDSPDKRKIADFEFEENIATEALSGSNSFRAEYYGINDDDTSHGFPYDPRISDEDKRLASAYDAARLIKQLRKDDEKRIIGGKGVGRIIKHSGRGRGHVISSDQVPKI